MVPNIRFEEMIPICIAQGRVTGYEKHAIRRSGPRLRGVGSGNMAQNPPYAAAHEQLAIWHDRIGINLLTDGGPEYTVLRGDTNMYLSGQGYRV